MGNQPNIDFPFFVGNSKFYGTYKALNPIHNKALLYK